VEKITQIGTVFFASDPRDCHRLGWGFWKWKKSCKVARGKKKEDDPKKWCVLNRNRSKLATIWNGLQEAECTKYDDVVYGNLLYLLL